MVIVGMGALQGQAGEATTAALAALQTAFPNLVNASEEWNGINILHTAASRPAALELGFVPGMNSSLVTGAKGQVKLAYLVGAEELLDRQLLAEDAFVVYQGHHGDSGAEQADLVLPSPAYTEKSATYINLEGRVQRTVVAVGRLANAREDWAIFRAISEVIGKPLPYNSLEEVRQRLVDISPAFAHLDTLETTSFMPAAQKQSASASTSTNATYQPYLTNYYMTNPISRSSKTMAKASAQLPVSRNSYQNSQSKPVEQAGAVRSSSKPVEGRAGMHV
jgi:NADH-quinone oxidoreductase subunit G